MLIYVLSMQNHMMLNISPHYQGWSKFTKRTMEQVNFQCSYVMYLQEDHGNLFNMICCKSVIHNFKLMQIHLRVIVTHPFLGNLGHLNPKTNLSNKVGVGWFNCMLNPCHLICEPGGFVNLGENQNIWALIWNCCRKFV